MNALSKAQAEYDNRLPDEQVENPAIAEWIEHSAQMLMDGSTVEWGYRKSEKVQVTADEFYTALQLYLVDRQIDGKDNRDAFARLVAANLIWGHRMEGREEAEYLIGSKSAMKDIAVSLLARHAERAVALHEEYMRQSEECGF